MWPRLQPESAPRSKRQCRAFDEAELEGPAAARRQLRNASVANRPELPETPPRVVGMPPAAHEPSEHDPGVVVAASHREFIGVDGAAASTPLDDLDLLTSGAGRCPLAPFRHRPG